MAVIIQNVSPHNGEYFASQYEVAINRDVIATFKHWRGDGLAVCLRKAADAVEASGHPNPYGDQARSPGRED